VKHLDGTLSISILDGGKLAKGMIPDAKWNLVTYNTAQRFIDKIQALNPDLIVLDECHKINHENTLQSRNIKGLDSRFKLAVSGSLFKNRRSELYSVLNWLFPEDFHSRDKFVKEYCLNDAGLFRLQYELRNRMVHRFKDQVLNLPPVDFVRQEVFFSPEAKKEYAEVEEDFVNWYKSEFQEFPPFGSIVLSKMHSLRLRAIGPKYPVLDDILSKILEGNKEKVVIYSSYRDVVHGIADKYNKKYGTCCLTGESSGTERAAQINRFNEDWKRIFVVSAAGGESVDLTAASNIIYMNKPLTYADEKQMLDRLHRRRQTRPVISYNLVTADSIDARIENLISKKREEYKRTVHDAFGYEPEIRDTLEYNLKELVIELVNSRSSQANLAEQD
jgi:SNF2 family DNA or RNA helicase